MNVLKVCNNCLPRNQVPVWMGERAKVRHCRFCHMKTIWSFASPEQVAECEARIANMERLLQSLIDEA